MIAPEAYDNIPAELKALPQWVVANADKIPRSPEDLSPASVTNSETWGTYEDAISCGKNIGFVLTSDDPFCIIDLDDKPEKPLTKEQEEQHRQILFGFGDSYQEYSVSGRGVHVVIKGAIPSGLHRGSIEIYSNERYMLFTGRTLGDIPKPVVDYNIRINQLYSHLKVDDVVKSTLTQVTGNKDDWEILEWARNAADKEKFNDLYYADPPLWQALNKYGYPSQSEADHALLAILAFYTNDNDQVRRLFRMSKLGQRTKATKNDKHIDNSLSKIRAKQAPPVDMTAMKASVEQLRAESPPPVAAVVNETISITPTPPDTMERTAFPDGLVGEVAGYIFSSAVLPVRELALAASIAFIGGIAGRSYNVSGTGLNQYIMLLADTGTGKEGMKKGTDRLVNEIRKQVPSVSSFIGPGRFASGKGILRKLSEQPCVFSILGEFGEELKTMCSTKAKSWESDLKSVLLDVYGKSGNGDVLYGTAYSDSEKNTSDIDSPALTILGETTASGFFEGLDTSHIAAGLIPRFTIFEYKGPRVARNRNCHKPPSEALTSKLTELVTVALTAAANHAVVDVGFSQGAENILDKFDLRCTAAINAAKEGAIVHLWNRGHLKALKLAAILATGNNPHNPVITLDDAKWAVAVTDKEISSTLRRFKSGNYGDGINLRIYTIKRVITSYLESPFTFHTKSTPQAHSIGLIPKALLSDKCRANTKIFTKDNFIRNYNEALEVLVNEDQLVDVDPATRKQVHQRIPAFGLGANWGSLKEEVKLTVVK